MKVNEFWDSGGWAQRPQNIKKSRVGNFCHLLKNSLNVSTLTPNISKKCPWKFFRDFWLNQPSQGWRTRIWPKTGTRSSFSRHFLGKTNFYVFLGIFSARCYGPERSIFGLISYFMEWNIWRKFQGFGSNIIYLSPGGLVDMGKVRHVQDAILGHLYLDS